MKENYIKSLELKNFTAFDEINFEFSPGINVFIGANATGKTHILKFIYSLSSLVPENNNVNQVFDSFLKRVGVIFLPENRDYNRLVRRGKEVSEFWCKISDVIGSIEYDVSRYGDRRTAMSMKGFVERMRKNNVYIPPKDILTNAHGFIPEYEKRFLEFEEIYKDILIHAYTPGLKSKGDEPFFELLKPLEEVIGGKVIVKGDRFYLKDKRGLLEFTLLAEGFSKLGLLWLLINNGSIEPGCTLFWDEPETNLNPSLLQLVIRILLELQRHNVQVFVATHNYVLLKEFDLQMEETDEVMFHSLYRDEETGSIKRKSTNDYMSIHPDVINDTYLDLYFRDMNRDSDRDRNDNG